MTKNKLLKVNIEWQKQSEVDRLVIHNKLKTPERQPNETIHDYQKRVKELQILVGYKKDDFIVSW